MLSAKDIESGKILIPQDCRRISIEDYNSIFKNYNLKINDILLTIVGTIGRVAMVDNLTNKYALQRSVAIIRVNSLNHPLFIFYLLQTNNIKKQYYSKMNQSAQGGIYLDSLNKLSFKNTILSEQEKIAKFLSIVDKRIEKQRQLVESLKKYKRGLFNKIFSSFVGEYITLENILVEVNEKSKINNEYPIISSTKQGLFLQSDYFNKQAASENTIGYKILRKGQIVFSPQNLWMGNINYNSNFEIGIVSPSYKIYQINKKFNPYFIGVLLKEPIALKEYMLASEQGASIVRRNLNLELFNNIKFKIPTLEIQDKLAVILKTAITIIDKEELYLSMLNKYKNGLLQQMFI